MWKIVLENKFNRFLVEGEKVDNISAIVFMLDLDLEVLQIH